MNLAEMERLAAEGWPLVEYSRRELIALYEHHEALREALQTALTMLREERYYADAENRSNT
jgi:ATP phosphoribosyltransferase regulatory subunit HisZ